MNTILAYLSKALGIFEALIAAGVVKSPAGTDLTGIATKLVVDIQNVIAGTAHPDATLIAAVSQLLTDLKVNGIFQGQFIDELVNDAAKAQQFITAIQSNPPQVGIGPKESIAGVAGSWTFIPDGMPDKPFGL